MNPRGACYPFTVQRCEVHDHLMHGLARSGRGCPLCDREAAARETAVRLSTRPPGRALGVDWARLMPALFVVGLVAAILGFTMALTLR